MKLYRAIEFSKLSFMLSSYGSIEWNQALETYKSTPSQYTNWWFEDHLQNNVKYIIADVIANGKEAFFKNSMTFNSTVGGRYNPPNSFGIMYTASNPALAALEVLYHINDSNKKFHNNTARTRENFEREYNIRAPKESTNLIVVFTIDVDPNFEIVDYTNSESIKQACSRIGFNRYTEHEDYDDNFIFGNNYEVSRILGCYLNSHYESKAAFKFNSARIVNNESTLEHHNVIFPETFIGDNDLRLSNEYYLIETKTSIDVFNNLHKVKLGINGQSSIRGNISLEKYMDEKKYAESHRVNIYRPNIPAHFHPNLNARKVVFQRFVDGLMS